MHTADQPFGTDLIWTVEAGIPQLGEVTPWALSDNLRPGNLLVTSVWPKLSLARRFMHSTMAYACGELQLHTVHPVTVIALMSHCPTQTLFHPISLAGCQT